MDGQPCQRCVQHGRYCYQHVDQDPKSQSKSRPSAAKEERKSNTTKGRVYGIRLDGHACTRCMKEGGYCHQHTSQATQKRHPRNTKAPFGVCRDGRPCMRCAKQQGYCHQHVHQQAFYYN
jgi:hypothetical protein